MPRAAPKEEIVHVGVRIPVTLMKRIKALAKSKSVLGAELTVSDAIRMAIDEGLRSYTEKATP